MNVESLLDALAEHDITLFAAAWSDDKQRYRVRLCDRKHHKRLVGMRGTLFQDDAPPFYVGSGPSLLAALGAAAFNAARALSINITQEKPLT